MQFSFSKDEHVPFKLFYYIIIADKLRTESEGREPRAKGERTSSRKAEEEVSPFFFNPPSARPFSRRPRFLTCH